MCENLTEKYSNLCTMANDALENKWDTREELMQVAKPTDTVRIKSLQASKKSFRRNRELDTKILNERSSEMLMPTDS